MLELPQSATTKAEPSRIVTNAAEHFGHLDQVRPDARGLEAGVQQPGQEGRAQGRATA